MWSWADPEAVYEVGTREGVDGFCPRSVGRLRLRGPDGSSRCARRRECVEERDEGLGGGGLLHIRRQENDDGGWTRAVNERVRII